MQTNEYQTNIKDTKQIFQGYMKPTAYDVTTTSSTQPQKNMITKGQDDTSDLIEIIR